VKRARKRWQLPHHNVSVSTKAAWITHYVHILEMNGDSYRLKQGRRKRNPSTDR